MFRSCHGLNGREFEQISRDGEGLEEPGILQSMGLQRIRHDSATKQQEDTHVHCSGFNFLCSKICLPVICLKGMLRKLPKENINVLPCLTQSTTVSCLSH